MRAVFSMWKYVRMIVLVAVIAAIYAAIYIGLHPFSIQLIPGVLSFTWRDLFIMFFGVLFGPAGAFGVGIGNVIGDFFTGSLAIGSIFGFLTSFITAYIGYTLWSHFQPTVGTASTSLRVRQVGTYLLIGIISALAGAVVLAWGLNLLGLAPFQIVSVTLFADLGIGNWIGGLFYLLVFRRIKSLGVDWKNVMNSADVGKPLNAIVGVTLLGVGGLVGWILGTFILHGATLIPIVGIFFLAIIVGAILL